MDSERGPERQRGKRTESFLFLIRLRASRIPASGSEPAPSSPMLPAFQPSFPPAWGPCLFFVSAQNALIEASQCVTRIRDNFPPIYRLIPGVCTYRCLGRSGATAFCRWLLLQQLWRLPKDKSLYSHISEASTHRFPCGNSPSPFTTVLLHGKLIPVLLLAPPAGCFFSTPPDARGEAKNRRTKQAGAFSVAITRQSSQSVDNTCSVHTLL